MNPEVKKLWIDALRSGNYSQGKFSLRTKDDNYCCLGVLCELAVKSEIIPPPYLPGWDQSQTSPRYLYDGHNGRPSEKVRDWADVSSESVTILISLNDDAVLPFAEIAAWIEANL